MGLGPWPAVGFCPPFRCPADVCCGHLTAPFLGQTLLILSGIGPQICGSWVPWSSPPKTSQGNLKAVPQPPKALSLREARREKGCVLLSLLLSSLLSLLL